MSEPTILLKQGKRPPNRSNLLGEENKETDFLGLQGRHTLVPEEQDDDKGHVTEVGAVKALYLPS